MSPVRPDWRPRTWPVRWRLAAVSAGSTLVILVIFGVIVGNLVTDRVRDDFARETQRAAESLASQVRIYEDLSGTYITRKPDLGSFVSANDASVRIYDGEGQQIDSSPNAADLGAPIPGVHYTGDMRVITLTLGSPRTGRLVGFVQYGRDQARLDATVGRLQLLIAAGVLGATLLAGLAGVVIARRTMRPISSLTSSARHIAETGDLSRHMPAPRSEDEVGELAETLEEMLRSLDAARAEREAALSRQREFVADASHELRTPLTSILANLELLQDSLRGAAQEEERAMVGSALRSSGRMSRLVSDLLLLARADAGRDGTRGRCDLAEAAGNAAAEVAPTVGDRELLVDNDVPLPIDGNADELHRMVLNLLDNAVRHTPPGSTVELRLRSEGEEAVLEVADDGPGVPEEMREQVFERFVRGEGPADTAVGAGSGLGLSIVNSVATSHGGSAEVAESERGGALFRIRLPLRRSDREPGEKALDPV